MDESKTPALCIGIIKVDSSPCTNEAEYGDYCSECLDNRIDYLKKTMESVEKEYQEKTLILSVELLRLISLKPLPVKVCCKCRPIVFCIRHRKHGDSLETYCPGHLPKNLYKNQKNVDSLSEDRFRALAGWPPKEGK